ncbi:MAG: SDR family NAD(P)-dependent oxidoreductase, partial [Alphaproteobacteria bacterium]|nr:SDR family NAD(P)-dependent oxidoreductase [Alphaproteobacteria bacterium]
ADAPPAPEKILSALFADFPEALPALLSARRTGENLTEAFCGEASAPALLQPAHGVYASEMLFSAAPSYSGINHALREMLRAAAVDWPENRRLRILEIAGTANSLPHDLKDCLPQNRVDYVIAEADADRHAVLKAEYHGHPFVTVASLDAEDVTLSAETMLPAEYDVVIVNHYLHRAPNVMATAAALRRFLAKGGRLVLAERHPSYVADFTFGPDPAWWRTTGAGYSSSLRAPGMWEALLKTQGFDDVGQFIEQADGETETGSFLLLASNPESIVQTPAPAPSTWLLLGGGDTLSASLAERLSARLTAQGQAVEFVQAEGSGDAAQMTRLLQRAQEEMNAVEHVVFFGAMNDAAEPALPTNDDTRCMDALHLVQAVAAQGNGKPRLWFVTSGGALVTEPRGDWAIHPAAAPLWGLGRVVMNEVPDCSCTLIDMACDVRADEAVERLQAELLFPDDEREIVLSADARFALRLQHDAQENAGTSAGASGFQLDFTVPGHLRNLSWLPKEEQALGEDEIEVRPAAVGLNFRDIMYAMGLLPDEAVENGFAGATLGLEFAGTITRVGAKTGEFSVGDEVMGFGAGCFSSHVVTKACAVTKKPEGWTFAQAATVPTTFFTAYYAIKRLANLQPGERILIHGAAGGVGIAAIQLARYLGAEIFATAGTEEKRDFVRLLGADHVLDSRSLDFADDILGITGGEGIDVVLNSLSGEAISRNLRVLKPFGRFLELGKRDFYENTHIGLAPFRNNISYFGIDADQLLVCQPHIAPVVFGEVMALFDSGDLTPLPYKTFAAERVADAFRYMQQSRHIGKVVVDLADARVPVQQQDNAMAASAPGLADANSSYLVTGGLEGFGLETACRLATLGVKSLVLLSRRGKESPGAAEAVARLEALGAQAHVFACDVNDLSVLEVVFAAIKKDLPPLKGIVHAAAVFDDGLLSNMEEERFSRVLQPKTLGAWNLHSLSAGLPLDHFILYSSISTLIGNPGQGNYVAANAYLEALASWRQASGLPATCISWGPIGDAGYLSRNDAVKENLASRLGAAPLSVQQALALLPSILAEKRPHIAIADFNLLSLGRFLPSASGPRFEALRHFMDAGETANETDDILELIAGKPRQEVQQIVQDIIVSEVAGILRVSYERVHLTRPLQQLGMDSLMAVELVIALEQRFGVSLPAMAMSDDQANIERISARIADKLCGEETADNADNIEDLVSAMAAQHIGEVSEQDLSETIEEVRERSLEKGRLIS